KKTSAPDLGFIHSITLDNGSALYVRENPLAPIVNLQVWERTGSINEGERLGCGLSHFLEHVLFQGSKKYSQSRIMEVVHSNGGEMNAYTSFASTVYHINILSEAALKVLDVLVDVVFNPAFPTKAFKTEKDVILREAAMTHDNPDRALGELLWKTVFRRHPVRHPIIGYPELIETVDSKMTAKYHRTRYTSDRTYFVVAGDVEADRIADFLNTRLADVPRIGCEFEPPIIDEPEQKCRRNVETRFDDPLARLDIGFRIPDSTSNDIPALDLISSVLGHSKSSRLVRKLRDSKRIALNIDAYTYSSVFDGMFTVSATCAPDKLDELESAVFAELSEIGGGVAADELIRAKRQMTADLYHAMRSNGGVARLIGNSVMLYGSPDYACKYLEDVSNVGHEEIASVAERYLDSQRATAARMLPPENDSAAKKRGVRKTAVSPSPTISETRHGARLAYLRDSTTPIVDVAIVFPGGSISETADTVGISNMTARLLMTGTKNFPEREFAKTFDDNAVNLSVSGGSNTISVRMSCLKDALEPALEAFLSMLSEPLFSEDKLERERDIILESLKSRAMSPQSVAEDKMRELLYGSHPYALPKYGRSETLSALTSNALRDYYFNTVLNVGTSVFGIAGDISERESAKLAEKISKTIPWSSSATASLPDPPVFPDSPKRGETVLPREQSVVLMGMKGCSNTSPDRFALDVVQTALNGLETRLFKSIRGDAGLAYYTGLYSSRGIHDGFLAFYAGTQPKSVVRVIDLITKEQSKLARNGLTKDEFSASLARLKGDAADHKLNTAVMIFECALSEFYGNGFLESWDIMERYSKLTLAKVNSIAGKYFANKTTATAVAGPKTGG
ncbi:MAG: insulinase family protein, partial [Kiritimatiellaeota bacterium]|nr:insulinase family protein [Kiritimatiellota bacterium]